MRTLQRTSPAVAVALLAGLFLTGNSLATPFDENEDGTDDRQSTFIETAVVKARPLEEATRATTVIDRDEIDALNVATVAELLPFVPGVDVVSSGPRGGVSFAQIQGGDPNFTVILLDGVPLNDGTNQLGGAVNLNAISTQLVERIEVVRGPTSSFYGSSALSGVINIITRRGDSETMKTRAELTAGQDDFAQAAVSVSRGGENGGFFVGASWEQAEDQIVDDEFEQITLNANYSREIGERTALRINGRVANWDARDLPDASGGVLGSGETRTSEHDDVSLGFDLLLGAPERRQKIYASVSHREMQRQSPLIFNAMDPPSSIPAAVEDSSYLNARAGWSFPAIARQDLRLNAGVEAVFEDGKNDSVLDVGMPLPAGYALERNTVSAMMDLLADRGRVLVEFGVRVDKAEDTSVEASPNLGLVFRSDSERTRFRVNVGRAFKLASFYSLANPLVGDPDLDPETSVGGSVGVEHDFSSGKVDMAVSAFFYRFSDLIDFDPMVFSLVNRDRVTSRGAEASVTWRAGERITVRGNLTFQDVEDDATGNRLKHRPEWTGAVQFDWRVNDRLRWTLDGRVVDDMGDVQISVPTRTMVPGYELFGTALSYRFGPSWSLDARVNNLLDESYETLIGFPGLERQLLVSVRFQTN